MAPEKIMRFAVSLAPLTLASIAQTITVGLQQATAVAISGAGLGLGTVKYPRYPGGDGGKS